MKICLVNSFFPPWRGGAETYTYNLARQLVKSGNEVEIFCAAPPREPGSYTVENLKVNCLPITGWLYGTPIMTELPRRLLRSEADLIHAGFPSPYNAFATSTVRRIAGTPCVLTWHNDLPAVTSIAGLLACIHDQVVSPTYLRTYGKIISTSKRYAESSRILRRYKGKVRVVPNGVDCERFHPFIDPSPVRSNVNLREEKIILFVGALSRWHGYKGLDILIKAFASANRLRKDIALMIVGDGNMRQTYEKLASDLNLNDGVFFVGNVSDEALPSYYAASDLLVLPSKDRSEGFGLTILEANACGRPAIGSNVGGIPDVISHGFNGFLVPPNSTDALCQAITTLVENDSMREAMGRNGRTFAEEHDWSRVAEATEKVYREAADQRQFQSRHNVQTQSVR